MRFGATESFLWLVTIGLEIALAVLVLRRRRFHTLPFFTFYALFDPLRDILVWAGFRWLGFNSLPAFYVAWSSQAILLLTRGAVSAELCRKILRKSPELFRTMVRDLLVVVGVGVVLYTAFDSLRKIVKVPSSILAIERGLELAIALVLLVLLRVAVRYYVRIKRAFFLIATGLCFYSLVLTINDTFLDWLNLKFPWWNEFRLVAFLAALALWIWAFLTRDFDSDDKPVPSVPKLYAEHAEEVSRKLRSLEKDIEEIARK
jgi:hypothetical protein